VKTLFCIVGESGSGKSQIAYELDFYGYKSIQSYTTRKPRKQDEWGHTFCDEAKYQSYRSRSEIVAYSYFNNNHYFATREQIMHSDIYIVDPDGIEDLKSKVKDVRFVVVYLNVDPEERIARMQKRGDSMETINERLAVDEKKFANKKFDYAVKNDDMTKCIDIIRYIIDLETEE
jgi:guanylate kinase